MVAERERIAPYLEAEPDKTIALVAEMDMGEPEPGEKVVYACPMHPEVVSDDPWEPAASLHHVYRLDQRNGRASLPGRSRGGLLPIPGPVDEAILLIAAPLLYVFGRESDA